MFEGVGGEFGEDMRIERSMHWFCVFHYCVYIEWKGILCFTTRHA